MTRILRSAVAVLFVGIALAVALGLEHLSSRPSICPFILAVMASSWWLDAIAGTCAVVASILAVDYFIVEPGSFWVSMVELPRFVCFSLTTSLVAWFVAARRRAEVSLREVNALLEAEVDDKSGQLEAVLREKEDRERSSTRHRMRAEDMKRKLEAIEAECDEVRALFETLTPRERDVYRMVMDGLLNKQIASKLGIAEITVKVHRKNLMRKMGAETFAELVRMGERLRITPSLKS